MAEQKTPLTVVDIRAIDARYRPFPSFEAWSQHPVNLTRWNRYTRELEQRRTTASPELLNKANDIVRRAAAIDTGAIEGLYEVDSGFTLTVAKQAAFWEAALAEKGEEARGYIEAQLEAYEYILDLATEETPISEASIRSLHEIMCRNQETYTAITEIGPQQVRLKKGEYKTSPNHVRGRSGDIHAYAPTDITPSEMHRLMQELRSERFINAHPALQASYAHYAFVVIHPFADGNGRVARALASIFTYRAQSVPLLILFEKRDEYIDALEKADKGKPQDFINFVLERTLDSIQLVEESLRAAKPRSSRESLQGLRNLNRTQSGYTHAEIDQAALDLAQSFYKEIHHELLEYESKSDGILKVNVTGYTYNYQPASPNYRVPRDYRATTQNQAQSIIRGALISFSTQSLPKNVNLTRAYAVSVPQNSDTEDDIIIQTADTRGKHERHLQPIQVGKEKSLFAVRVSELLPQPSAAVQMRLAIFVQGLIDDMLAELEDKAREALDK